MRRLLNDAVENGEIIYFQHVKVFLTGSSAAGKTSFRRSLFMEPYVEEYESTKLQETKHAYVVSILESKHGEVKWLELTAEQQINHFRSLLEKGQHAKRSTTESSDEVKINRMIKNNDNKSNYEAPKVLVEKLDKSNGLESDLVFPNPLKLVTVVDTGGQPEFIHMLPAIVNCPTINFVIFDMTKKLTDKVEVYYKDKEDTMQSAEENEEDRIKVEVPFKINEECKVKKEDKEKAQIHYRLNEEEKVKVKGKVEIEVYYKRKKDKIPLSYLSYSYEDLIKLLMSITIDSVNQPVIQKRNALEPNSSIFKQQDAEKEISKSYIGFVGTHKDKTTSETIIELNKQLAMLVGRQNQENCHVSVLGTSEKYLHPIDNTISGSNEDSELVEIRKEIEVVTNDMVHFPVPIAWMILEIQVKSFCEFNSQPYITLDEFSDMADREASIKSKEDVNSVLQYFNSLGIFLYFEHVPEMKNYVITDHQWFCSTLCKITCMLSDTSNSSIIDHDSQKEFKKDGLLQKKKLCKMKWNEKIKIECFVKLLLYMKIIACYKKEFYYIPLVLPHCERYHDKYRYLLLEPLLIRFSSGFLPRGFFCSLVVHLLQNVPMKWRKVDFNQNYRNVITFRVFDKHNEFFLRLQDKIYYLEIEVRHHEYFKRRCMFPELEILRDYLNNVCTNLKFDPSKLQYGFLCHGDSEDDHMVVLDSIQDPVDLEGCKKCGKQNFMGPLHKIWFEDVSFKCL